MNKNIQKYVCKISVLIPCYNEEKTIKKVIKDFQIALPDATIYVTTILPIRLMKLPEKLAQ